MAERIPEPLLLLDARGTIRYANPPVSQLTGRDPQSLEGVHVASLVHPDERRRVRRDLRAFLHGNTTTGEVEFRVRARDETWRTVKVTGSNLLDLPAPAGILIQATDVTDRVEYAQGLHDLAYRHPITGVANRRALEQRVARELACEQPLAVAFVDLDHFKRINDCLGHTTGDTVLAAATARMRPLVPPTSLLGHFAGDVFTLVLIGLDADSAVDLVWQMLGRLSEPVFVSGHELRLSASAGLAFRGKASTAECILRNADAALTRAKTVRRGGVEVFTDEMRAEATDRLELECDLRGALQRDELEVHLQPVIRLATGEVDGHEALARWTRPNGRSVVPERFIPIAEEAVSSRNSATAFYGASFTSFRTGDRSASASTCRRASSSTPRYPARRASPRCQQYHRAQDVLRGHRNGRCRELRPCNRITQRAAPTRMLRRPRRLRYRLLVAGYLRKLPLDFVKLDRALIADVDTDPQAALIGNSVVSLAHALSLVVVAEGIERQSQLAAVTDMGCRFGQGWLFGHPVAAPT